MHTSLYVIGGLLTLGGIAIVGNAGGMNTQNVMQQAVQFIQIQTGAIISLAGAVFLAAGAIVSAMTSRSVLTQSRLDDIHQVLRRMAPDPVVHGPTVYKKPAGVLSPDLGKERVGPVIPAGIPRQEPRV